MHTSQGQICMKINYVSISLEAFTVSNINKN
jgi:hypothetical protein